MAVKNRQQSVVAKVTSKNQITVPKPVREALQIGKQDKLKFSIKENGEVLLEREEPDDLWSIVEKQEKVYGNLSTPEPDWGADVGVEDFD